MLGGRISVRGIGVSVIAVAGIASVALITHSIWKASQTLQDSARRVSRDGIVPLRSISLDKNFSSGFEFISSPAQFRDATFFNGRFYLCGSSGLYAFDSNGSPIAKYRPGFEIPPAPLVAMAAGVGMGTNEPRLWIATAGEGLLVFDGRSFIQLRADEAAFRNVTAVLPLSNGRVLVGSEKNGVLAWDGQNLARYHSALNDLQVTALAGIESDLWIGTMDRGVLHWRAGQLEHFAETEGLPDPRILSIAMEGEAAYVGTALGVTEFRSGRFSRLLASGFFARTLLSNPGSVTVGTMDEGVITVSTQAEKPRLQNVAGQSEMNDVQKLFAMNGKVYAVARGGLYEQDSKAQAFKKVLEIPGAALADSNISALAVDKAGRLWTGYFDRGLDILEPDFTRAAHVEDEHIFCVNRIVHHKDGGMSAIGTANGLVLFDASGHERRVLGKAEGLIANQVSDVLLDGTSGAPVMTVATPAGITTIDAGGASSIYAFHGLVNNHVYALAAAHSRLLAGTLGGLSILDSGVVKASFTTANSGLRHNWITAIAPVGDDWFVGTYGAGVLKLDTAGRWSTFPDWKSIGEINTNAMLVTDRAVYAGTLTKGLAIYRRGSGRWTFHTAGLPSLNVTALTAANGYLYAGTDNGLVRVRESDLLQ